MWFSHFVFYSKLILDVILRNPDVNFTIWTEEEVGYKRLREKKKELSEKRREEGEKNKIEKEEELIHYLARILCE